MKRRGSYGTDAPGLAGGFAASVVVLVVIGFDVVVSSLAIHDIHAGGGREKALAEAARVLRPGGRLLIADLPAARKYQGALRELGMADVQSRGAGWRMWWGGPWVGTTFVAATKPVSS
jgi:SAM-dependent methyltransferase